MAAAAAALHMGLEVRLVPSSLMLCNAPGEEKLILVDPIQEEISNDAGKCLVVLDKSGSILFLQEQGPINATLLVEALHDVSVAKDACSFVETRVKEDLAARQTELRTAYVNEIKE